ncbi:MAG: hypothetical protein ACK5RL_08325 [Acidimicrobiales bacterium]
MSEKIPIRFRKTRSGSWAVMGPVEDLEQAVAGDGKVEVLKRSGDTSSFTVASLGRPFDVDGVQMCYGYAAGDGDGEATDEAASSGGSTGSSGSGSGPGGGGRPAGGPDRAGARRPARRRAGSPPPVDPSEPLPVYQGGPEDEAHSEF